MLLNDNSNVTDMDSIISSKKKMMASIQRDYYGFIAIYQGENVPGRDSLNLCLLFYFFIKK